MCSLGGGCHSQEHFGEVVLEGPGIRRSVRWLHAKFDITDLHLECTRKGTKHTQRAPRHIPGLFNAAERNQHGS